MDITLDVPCESARERFAEAVTEYRIDMYRVCRSLLDSDADAEDAVSEAVLRAWASFGRLRDAQAFKSWLIKIAVNCAYEHRRKNVNLVYPGDLELIAGAYEDGHNFGLWDLVMRLPDDFRAATVMYYFSGMSTKDIAKALKVREGTVRSRLSRARKMLRTVLEEGQNDEF